jgi:hypothetical protein
MQLKTAKAPMPVAQPVPVSKPHPQTAESNQAHLSVMTSTAAAERPRSDTYGEAAGHDDEGCPIICGMRLLILFLFCYCH